MRVVLLSTDPGLPLAGPQRAAIHLRAQAGAWIRSGHSVTAIVAETGPPHAYSALTEQGLEVRTLRHPVSEREIDWHLSHVRPDLVVERLSPTAPHGSRAAAEAGITHLFDVHDRLDEATLSGAGCSRVEAVQRDLVEGFAASTGSVCGSLAIARWVRSLAPRHHATLVEPGSVPHEFMRDLPTDRLRAGLRELQIDPWEFRIGFAASRASSEDLLTLVEAAARVQPHVRVRLLGIGDGPNRNVLLRRACELGVGLVLCGPVAAAERPARLMLCDVVVIPHGGRADAVRSQDVLDLMAIGRPVVAGDSEAMRRLIRSGQHGLLVEPGDANAMGAALTALARTPALASALGAAARQRAAGRHSYEAVTGRVIEFAEELRSLRRDTCGA